jgi:hypothetical protein
MMFLESALLPLGACQACSLMSHPGLPNVKLGVGLSELPMHGSPGDSGCELDLENLSSSAFISYIP